MVQINIVLLAVATIIPALAHAQHLAPRGVMYAREDTFDLDLREPSWNAVAHPMRTWREHRKVKAITAAAKANAVAGIKQEHADVLSEGATERREYIDLEEREPSWDAVAHPMRTWREHRRVKAITAAAKADAVAGIKQEHADALGENMRREYMDLEEREPSWDAIAHPMRTWREHRRVKAITAAAKADAVAGIKQEHADALGATERREYMDLEEREPSWDAVAHPMRTWREHHRVKVITAAAKANAVAGIKQEHADALGGPERREYFNEDLAERDLDDDFDFEARDFEEEYY